MRWLFVLLIGILVVSDILAIDFSLGPGLSIKNALLYLIAFGLFFRFVLGGKRSAGLPLLHALFAVWVVYGLLSWIIAGYFIEYPSYDAMESAIRLKAGVIDPALLFFCLFYGVRDLDDARLVTKALLIAIAIANLATVTDVLGLTTFGVRIGDSGAEEGRVFGVFGHANETGALIVCLLPAMIAAAFASHGWRKLLWIGAIAVSAVVLVMTVSRGAYVAVVVGTAWAAYVCRRFVPASHVAAGGALAFGSIVLVLVFATLAVPSLGETVMDRLLGQSTAVDVGEASSGRTAIWLEVIQRMMAVPVTLISGYGWDAYSVMPFRYAAHNHYLNLWFNLGVIGLGAFVLIIRHAVLTAREAVPVAGEGERRNLIAFVFGILSLCVAIFFTNIPGPWLYIWMYVGVTMRMAVLAREQAPAEAWTPPDIERPIADVMVRPAATSRRLI
jgi:hypothetical protein